MDGIKRHARCFLPRPRQLARTGIDPEDGAKPILKAEPMVTARLMECQADWCRIQLSGRKGWLEKKYIWGVYAQEVFE